jgi:hypothetical protein
MMILTGALGGCLGEMDLPKHFVSVDKAELGGYLVRGISADGVVVALRSQDNPKGGTLEFWAQAVENELATSRGYKLADSQAMTASSGLGGKMMTFSTSRSGTDFTYVVGVYVKGDKVLVAEAGGRADAVKAHADGLKSCLLSVR